MSGNSWVPQNPEHEASPEQVARREHEYNWIAPLWNKKLDRADRDMLIAAGDYSEAGASTKTVKESQVLRARLRVRIDALRMIEAACLDREVVLERLGHVE